MSTCPTCGDEFENDVGMKSHHTMVHGESLVPEQRQEVECIRCGEVVECNVHGNRNYCDDCLSKTRSEVTGEEHPRYKDKVEVECTTCDNLVELYPYRLEQNKEHFCSDGCFRDWQSQRLEGDSSPLWQGGSSDRYYGPNWQRQRRKTLERDDYECQKCGIGPEKNGRMLSVHHITPRSEFDDDEYKEANELSNLITLCDSCHAKIEKGDMHL